MIARPFGSRSASTSGSRHPISIRRKLQRNLIAVVILLGAAMIGMSWVGADRLTSRLGELAVAQAMDQVEGDLRAFYEPVSADLPLLAAVARTSRLRLEEPLLVSELLATMLRERHAVRRVAVAGSDGRLIELRRIGAPGAAVWRTTVVGPAGDGFRSATWFERAEDDAAEVAPSPDDRASGAPVPASASVSAPAAAAGAVTLPDDATIQPAADPRLGPWFAPAIEQLRAGGGQGVGPLHWEPVRRDAEDDAVVVDVSIAVRRPNGVEVVVTVELDLADLSEIVSRDVVLDDVSVYVVDSRMRLIGAPVTPAFDTVMDRDAALLRNPRTIASPVVANGVVRLFGPDPDAMSDDDGSADADRATMPGPRVPADVAAGGATDAATDVVPKPDAATLEAVRIGIERAAVPFRASGRTWWIDARATVIAGTEPIYLTVVVPSAAIFGGFVVLRIGLGAVVLLVLAGGILRVRHIAAGYSQPIEELVAQSDRISRGDLASPVSLRTDVAEVDRLAEAHERMRTGLQTLLQLERDLQIARQIQQSSFPDTLPETDGYDIAASSEPADATAGDTYDVFDHRPAGAVSTVMVATPAAATTPTSASAASTATSGDEPDASAAAERAADAAPATTAEQDSPADGAAVGESPGAATDAASSVVFLLADATGHGIGPCLSAMQLRGMVRMGVTAGLPLDQVLRSVDRRLCADLPPAHFLTAWLGELDPAAHRLTWRAAGQAPILHYDAVSGTVHVHAATRPPLGIPGFDEPGPATSVDLGRGDAVVVLSDGYFEARGATEERMGTDRVADLVAASASRGARAILEALQQAVSRFEAGYSQEDDRTAVVIVRQ